MANDTHKREDGEKQRRRVVRALDVLAANKLKESEKDDPVVTVPLKFIYEQADGNYATLMDNNTHYHLASMGGVKYPKQGKIKVKCHTYLRSSRNKTDRLDKIRENPKDHIFTEGGVSAD